MFCVDGVVVATWEGQTFKLSANGHNLMELIADAAISVRNEQDEEIDCYPLDGAPIRVYDAAMEYLIIKGKKYG